MKRVLRKRPRCRCKEGTRVYVEVVRSTVDDSLKADCESCQSGITNPNLMLSIQSPLIELKHGCIVALRELREAELDYLRSVGVKGNQLLSTLSEETKALCAQRLQDN